MSAAQARPVTGDPAAARPVLQGPEVGRSDHGPCGIRVTRDRAGNGGSRWRDSRHGGLLPRLTGRARWRVSYRGRRYTARAPSGRPVQLHIETKHPTRYGGLVERALVALLTRYGLATPLSRSVSPVTVMSYALTSLRRVHALAPVLPTVLLMDRVPVRYRDGRLPLQVSAAGVALRVPRKHPGYVQRVHAQGGALAVFTVDEPDDIELCLDLGVDVIISNHPQRVRERLALR